ncbi:ATP-binding protein [Anaerobacillus alkaliphilus]|uniref:ATP-binding protein n=1 Tax=Anaerobacillus alkaliphilus TaxID=1548597 RepID=UPI001375F1FD|nr:ATP-binding protein [Anaerobacillus alkaliphilus]
MEIVKDLVFNLFIIFVCYSVFFFLTIKKRGRANYNLVLLGSLAIILSMTFPTHLAEGLFIDLRLVPIALAGLYGGWRVCLLLTLVLISYRMYLGGDGMVYGIWLGIFHGLFISLISQHFHRVSYRRRVSFSILVGMISPLLIMLIIGYTLPESFSSLLFFSTVFMHLAAISLLVILSERINSIQSLYEHVTRIEKMEIVNHVASSFTHEIRNPITTVKGFLQLMKRPELKRQELDNYISIAINEVDRAEKIITEYLSFTKPTNENLYVIEGEQVLQNSVDVIRPLANSNCVDIKYKDLPFLVKANKQKLQQALINLFKNAIEAMPDGGDLFISVMPHGSMVKIMIKDTGVGMTVDQVSRLGEPYFSMKGEKGTGLGMMVVYNIIGAMGGTINVVSELGKGTTFILTLPTSSQLDEGETK